MSSRPQRATRAKRGAGDEEEVDAALEKKGRKVPEPRRGDPDRRGARERRSKHFADEVGGMASLIPKARKAESPGKPSPSPRGPGRPRKASEGVDLQAKGRGSKGDAEEESEEEEEEEGGDRPGEGGGSGGHAAAVAAGAAGKVGAAKAAGSEGDGKQGGEKGAGETRQSCAAPAPAAQPHGATPVTAAATTRPSAPAEPGAATAVAAVREEQRVAPQQSGPPQASGTPASPAISAMAALAAAATLASSMADAQKVLSTGNAQQDMRGTTSAEAAAAATKQQGEGSNSVLQTSQSMAAAAAAAMAAAAASGGVAGKGLLPVGWPAQGIAGAMLGAHQLAMQKWAHMAGAPIPVGVSMSETQQAQLHPANARNAHGAAGGMVGAHAQGQQKNPPLMPGGPLAPDSSSSEMRHQSSASALHTCGMPVKLVLWTPVDDALLKSSIEGGMSLSDIAAHIPFTSEFTVRDLEVRWRALLYDPVVSMEVAVELSALQGGKRVNLPHKRKAPSDHLSYSPRDQGDAKSANRSYPLGTAGYMLRHAVTADKVSGNVTVLEDATSAAGAGARSSTACLAAIDGVHSHYLLYKSLVVVGRRPKEVGGTYSSEIDVDLSLEGDARHVSRQQALVRRDMRGLWWLENVGKAAVFVNGNAVQRFASSELTGKVLLVIGGIRLTFDKV